MVACGIVAAEIGSIGSTGPSSAQGTKTQDVVEAKTIEPHFTLASNSTGNLVVYSDGADCLVAGPQYPALVEAAARILRPCSPSYVVVTEDKGTAIYGDGGWRSEGRSSAVVAQESQLRRIRVEAVTGHLASTRPSPQAPGIGFSQVIQLYLSAEQVHVIHANAGFTDADVIVHFEKSGVLFLGSSFTNGYYPRIDTTNGGSITGLIATADYFINSFTTEKERATPIIPGRGSVGTLGDLKSYRNMLDTVRRRIADLAARGMTVAQVKDQYPTREFDAEWGQGEPTPAEFVEMVYDSVRAQAGRPH